MTHPAPQEPEYVDVKGLFAIDGTSTEDVFDGWHDPGSRWNGFATPSFERAQAERVIAWVARSYADYDPENVPTTFAWDSDVLVQSDHEYDDGTSDEHIQRIEPDRHGRYPIGAYSWTWQEITIPQGWNLENWLDYGNEKTRVHVLASNLSNRRHIDLGIAPNERIPINNSVAQLAGALFSLLRPEDPHEELSDRTLSLAGIDPDTLDQGEDRPWTWASLAEGQRTTVVETIAKWAFDSFPTRP